MTKKPKVGNKVQYQLFNGVEEVFYGDIKEGEIIEIVPPDQFGKTYKTKTKNGTITLKLKEIKRIIS